MKIFDMKDFDRNKVLPFALSAFIVLADQIVKAIVVANIPLFGAHVRPIEPLGNDFLWIIHVRNPAIAFSIGHNLPETIRPALFVILPLVVLGFLLWYYFKSNEFTNLQRWVVAGIVGGGIGNIIDRIFRPDGVVDFVSVKFYGILGFDRWPTFNVADASVVVSCIILIFSIFSGNFGNIKNSKHARKEEALNEQKS